MMPESLIFAEAGFLFLKNFALHILPTTLKIWFEII